MEKSIVVKSRDICRFCFTIYALYAYSVCRLYIMYCILISLPVCGSIRGPYIALTLSKLVTALSFH